MSSCAQMQHGRSPFPSILCVVGFLSAGLTVVTMSSPDAGSSSDLASNLAASSWLGWTFVGAIWALALGLILGTLWQEYQARVASGYPDAEDSDDEDDDAPGMPGRYLIH